MMPLARKACPSNEAVIGVRATRGTLCSDSGKFLYIYPFPATVGLGPNSIGNIFLLEFYLEKSLEIPYTKKIFKNG